MYGTLELSMLRLLDRVESPPRCMSEATEGKGVQVPKKSSDSRVITRPDPHLKSKDRGRNLEVSLPHWTTLKVFEVDHLVICLELRKVFMLNRTAATLRWQPLPPA